jgi:DNA-binding transcriptional ArsR family regulator
MRALAHPARLAILDRLSTGGPATATECAEVTGQSPSACSYHLRALSRWGLVTESEGRDRRERRWAVTGPFVVGDHDERRAPAVAAAEHALTGQVLARATDRVLAWLDRSDDESPEWREATLVANRALMTTAGELTSLLEEIDRLCAPYVARERRDTAPTDARVVRLQLSAVPDPA